MHFRNVILISVLGAGLTACSSLVVQSVTSVPNSPVEGSIATDPEMDSLTAPYSRILAKEMNEIVGECKIEMMVERPNSNLGGWTCDLFVQFGKDSLGLADEPVIGLYNAGGLRAAITVGPITKGAVFQVMPFDNVVTAVKLPLEVLPEMLAYLKTKNGEPISGFSVVKGELVLSDLAKERGYVWVVTSDFLVNGGDGMLFLAKYSEKRETSVLIRDLLMSSIRKTRTLEIQKEERISW